MPQFKCPFCQNEAPPVTVKETNWVLFVILLLLCLPLCWLPFVCMQKEKRKCSACGTTLSSE